MTHGLAATGRTITAAAAIMVLVFGAFILGGERIIELFGVGLATAVLLDALIVRSALVPSLMLILGNANWWLPAGLERVLPHLRVEGSAASDGIGPAPHSPGGDGIPPGNGSAPGVVPPQRPPAHPAIVAEPGSSSSAED